MKVNSIIILFVSIVFLSCNRKTETVNSRNDSVEKYLKLAAIDTLPIETRKNYNDKAFSFIDLERNDTVVRWYLTIIVRNSVNLFDSTIFNKSSKQLFKKGNEVKDTLALARFYRFKGGYYKKNAKTYNIAYYNIVKSEKLYSAIKSGEIFYTLYQKALIQNDLNDYLGAELSLNLILKNKFGIRHNELIYNSWTLLGNVKHNLKDYYSAINCHRKALSLSKEFNLQNTNNTISYEGTSLNNIGNSYRELKNYNKAIYFFQKARNKRNFQLDAELEPYLLNNIGYCYLKTNNLKKLPFLFNKAARIFDSLKIENDAAITRVYLSDYYAKVKDTNKAIQYSELGLRLAKESKSSYYYLYALNNAGTINKKKASQYIAEYHRMNDSLLFEERKARNQYFKIQLETDEIAEEKEKAIQQKWVQTSVITSVLIIVILLFVIYKQRSQKKEFALIRNQQKANEEIYQLMLSQQSKEEEARQKEKKRIALELHDNVMNQLASTRFNLFSLTQENNSKLAKEHIDKIKAVEDEIRNLTHELVNENFTHDNSFVQLLQGFINQQNQLHPIDFQLILDPNPNISWDVISSEIKMNLYRIIQEAIHNCNKHSKSTNVEVRINQKENQITLIIKDNGIGFDPNIKNQGIGLRNMQQRIESIGGKLSINSAPGNGTLIRCSVFI